MTSETPTPETDSHSDKMDNEDFDVELAKTYDFARRLERERDAARAKIEAMREAIREAASHLSGFLGFYADGLTLEQVRALSATLDKLRPFLAGQKPQAGLDGGPGQA